MPRNKQKKKDYQRKVATRLPKKTFLIVCEGTKTEPNYFRSFPVLSAKVEIVGTGRNTLSLVRYAEGILQQRQDQFDEVWLVFDKDSFSADSFNQAINYCQTHYQEGFRVAYSNEAFELWYVLHYQLITRPISRYRYSSILTKKMGFRYKKNIPHLYRLLKERQPMALKNAKILYQNRSHSPAKDNPSTTVFQLVEELNRHIID
ncbi:RloB family protein [Jeotgalibaca sp. MA1X17-3]|uniref:RloB family protein n=1 Tax=Jeotgalibaca sp. MA1X17-3 TaxID=2908211 RepID=UPI001F2E5C68|nr:RloB family protein [Jeotgalibaca sp. MA1X17-3]UJF15229.1 RloB family protein [Jeotgalibaca sp. MA1X17-3]